jgi:hypothetical protein
MAQRSAAGAEPPGVPGMAGPSSEVAPPAWQGPMLDPVAREQRRIERRRARIEAQRLGIDPSTLGFGRRFMNPRLRPPEGFRNRPRWQDWPQD